MSGETVDTDLAENLHLLSPEITLQDIIAAVTKQPIEVILGLVTK